MNHIELLSELEDRAGKFDEIQSFAEEILNRTGKENWQIGILLTDDEGIQGYNLKWRNIDKPTDVLSFVQDDGESIPEVPGMPKEAGDIIISLETVERNAEEWDNSYDEELRRVIIHGILHLSGMDHPGDDYSSGMLKLQEELLADSGSLLKDNQ
jgi:probable rRNA maturation factor